MTLTVEALELKERLNPLSSSFSKGTLTTILGKNGAGKSTFLRLLSGVWQPTNGSIRYGGDDLFDLERHERSQIITYIPQSANPPFPYSVYDFVEMGRYHHKYQGIDRELELCNLNQLKDRSILEISDGERQRAYIARGLVTGAEVLLFDEPTAHLDGENSKLVWEMIQRLKKAKKIVIVATHDIYSSLPISDQLLVLKNQTLALQSFPPHLDRVDQLRQLLGIETLNLSWMRGEPREMLVR